MKSFVFAVSLALAGLVFADAPPPPPEAQPTTDAPPSADAPPAPPEAPPAPPPAPSHPQGIEKAAGVISGGWEYVYAAYGLAVLGIAGYGLSLFVRRPKQERAP